MPMGASPSRALWVRVFRGWGNALRGAPCDAAGGHDCGGWLHRYLNFEGASGWPNNTNAADTAALVGAACCPQFIQKGDPTARSKSREGSSCCMGSSGVRSECKIAIPQQMQAGHPTAGIKVQGCHIQSCVSRRQGCSRDREAPLLSPPHSLYLKRLPPHLVQHKDPYYAPLQAAGSLPASAAVPTAS